MARRRDPSEEKPSRRNEVDRARLLEYLLSHSDQPISNATLASMLGEGRSDSWTRRLRELRSPRYGGYTILSARDRADLASDEYWFPAQQRKERQLFVGISTRLRADVFARDAYTCQAGGLARGQRYEDGRAVTLHVGHDLAESHGGTGTLENCFTLCARCNEAESNIGHDRPQVSKTMAQVRRLAKSKQREIYDFLKSVFDP